MKRLALAALPLLLASRARDASGHKVIGVFAYRHFTPKAKAWCDAMLQTLPEGYRTFLDAALYPDFLKHGGPKNKPEVKRSRKYDDWHFIDLPIKDGQTSTTPYDWSLEGNGDNVIYGIKESLSWIMAIGGEEPPPLGDGFDVAHPHRDPMGEGGS